MSDFFRGYVTGILVYMVVLLAVPMCSSAKADRVSSTPYYKSLIAHEAVNQGLDPAVALAVAEVESSFNPRATGKAGEVGLFQLHPMFHKNPSYDVNKNIQGGVSHLLYWQKNCPMQKNKTWVNCYNAGKRFFRSPHTAPYFRKFNRAYHKYSNPSLAVAE